MSNVAKQGSSERAHLELAHRADKRQSLAHMAGCLAHDFNNILQVIGSSAEFALFDSDPRSAIHDSLQDILTATRRAADQCDRLLSFSGRGRLALANIQLGATLRELATALRGELPESVELELRIAPDLPPLEGDATQLRQLVHALIANAVEAMGDAGGKLTLQLELSSLFCPQLPMSAADGGSLVTGDYLRIELRDTGPGMSPEVLERAFEPFFSTRSTGRGLGLPAAAGIVAAHGGHIELYAQQDQGTRVEVFLPHCIAQLAPLPLPPQRAAPRRVDSTALDDWRGEGTALLVDDDPQARAAARRSLEHLGFRVLEAVDGIDALAVHARHHEAISCVLLDLTMPRMDGHTCLVQLRERDPDLCVLICSGYSEHGFEASHDADAFVAKPYALETLRQALAGALERRLAPPA